MGHNENGRKCWIESVSNYGGKLRVAQNDFSRAKEFALCVFYENAAIDARGNFWNTLDEMEIGRKVLDRRDSLSFPSLIEIGSPLKAFVPNSSVTSGSALEQAALAAAYASLAAVSAQEQAEEAKNAAVKASEKARLEAEKISTSVKNDSTSKARKAASIICVKKNQSLRVTGKDPICPKGYKKK